MTNTDLGAMIRANMTEVQHRMIHTNILAVGHAILRIFKFSLIKSPLAPVPQISNGAKLKNLRKGNYQEYFCKVQLEKG